MGSREPYVPEDLGVEYLSAIRVAFAQDATTKSPNQHCTCSRLLNKLCGSRGGLTTALHIDPTPSSLLSAMFTEASTTLNRSRHLLHRFTRCSLKHHLCITFRTVLLHHFIPESRGRLQSISQLSVFSHHLKCWTLQEFILKFLHLHSALPIFIYPWKGTSCVSEKMLKAGLASAPEGTTHWGFKQTPCRFSDGKSLLG